ncbi:MAG: endolytic transglycosylase MltG [Armatimonadota bacterium]
MKNKTTLIIVLACAFILIWFISLLFLPRGGSEKITVKIPKGSSAGEIGRILQDEGIIRSGFGFKLMAKFSGKGVKMKPGAYILSPSMSPSAVMDKIVRGDASSRWLTIPEGFTIAQIADKVEEEGFGKSGIFRSLARYEGGSFQTAFPSPGDNLEGYLFPDTYLLPTGGTESDIILTMLDCFNKKAYEPFAADIQVSGMGFNDIITLASLIEREARVAEDRPLISAVLHNRLKQRMRLGVDATVLYALGRHKDRVLFKDLEIDSPYNTYRNYGLPPGPIASPGQDSIKAALHPADADYLYYVAKPDGSHIFSRSFEEHKQAIAEARKAGN